MTNTCDDQCASDANTARYQIYLTERSELNRGAAAGANAFDRTLTSLSAGGIAFSLTYVQVFFDGLDQVLSSWLLLVSWTGFLVSLLVTLISFLTSQKAYGRQVEILETAFLHDDEEASNTGQSVENRWRVATNALNLVSLGAFIIGVVNISVFVARNLASRGG